MPAINTLRHRLGKLWDELDYAQRRSFELRTGVPVTRVARTRSELSELESVFSLQSRGH